MLTSIADLMAQVRKGLRLINIQAAKKEMATRDNAILLDVREPQEVIEQPVNGAVNIPRGVLEMQALQRFTDAQTPLYIHCATGIRASLAAEQLQRIGFENVSVITCDLETLCGQMNG